MAPIFEKGIHFLDEISVASETNKEKNCLSISDFFEQEMLRQSSPKNKA